MQSTKKCPSCGLTKPTTDFGRNQSLGDGLSFYCLPCNRERNNAWYRKRRQSMGLEVRDHSWVPDGFRWCPSCEKAIPHAEYARSRLTPSGFGSCCKACKAAADRASYFYRKYKLTEHAVDALRADQENRCAICGDPDPQHLDHDHATEKVRRLLCQRCNHGLGLFRDDPGLLHTAALYVTGHRQQHAFDLLVEAARGVSEEQPGERLAGRVGPGPAEAEQRARRQTQAGEADE
jgi:hypothetical protein